MLLASLPDLAALDWSALVWTDVVARLHPLLLHLPIGLLTLLFVAELWALVRRSKGERDGTRGLLVLLLFLTAPATALSGWFLRTEGYEGIEWHRNLGIALGVLSVLIAVAYWARARAYGALVAVGFGVMVAASHLGASITHGEEFLFEPWNAAAATPALQDPGAGGDPPAGTDGGTAPEEVAPAPALVAEADRPPTWADVEPILAELCTKCHGPRKQKGELALHSESLALLGGEHGPVITPEDWRSSPLLQAMALPLDHDDHMPPKEKRQPTAEELATLRAWIAGLAGEVPTPADAGVPPGTPDTSESTESTQPGPAGQAAAQTERPVVDLTAADLASGRVVLESVPATPPPSEARLAELEGLRLLAEQRRSETTEQLIARLEAERVDVTLLPASEDQPTPGLALDFTGCDWSPGGLGKLLVGPSLPLREAVFFNQELTALDLALLRQSAAAPGGLESLELRSGSGAPLDLGPLTQPADVLAPGAGAARPDETHHLRHLNLAGTELAPGAVAHLAALPSLESVHLWGTGLTDADLAELVSLRPDLELVSASAPPGEPLEVEPEVVFRRVDEPDDLPAGGELTDTLGAPDIDADVLAPENDTCPVSGSPVDPRYTVLYDGRLIGFCCPNCPKTFWADPEPYLAKLP